MQLTSEVNVGTVIFNLGSRCLYYITLLHKMRRKHTVTTSKFRGLKKYIKCYTNMCECFLVIRSKLLDRNIVLLLM